MVQHTLSMVHLQGFEPGTHCNIRVAKLSVRLTLIKNKKALFNVVHH